MDQLDMLQVYFDSAGLSPNMSEFVLDVLLIVVTAGILAAIYKYYGNSLSNRKLFARNFVILALTTMMIITIIKSSLALSLGLVGSLSIIRFRTAIKEPEELAYLFLVIALGVGFGAGQRYITLVFFLTIVIIIALRGVWNSLFTHKKNKNMHITIKVPSVETQVSDIVDLLDNFCSRIQVDRVAQKENEIEYMISAEIPDVKMIDNVSEDLHETYEGAEIFFSKR
jgi:uncharacterized membrane protein YhiD involved in acid resistance